VQASNRGRTHDQRDAFDPSMLCESSFTVVAEGRGYPHPSPLSRSGRGVEDTESRSVVEDRGEGTGHDPAGVGRVPRCAMRKKKPDMHL
jgi:hypothetical protein